MAEHRENNDLEIFKIFHQITGLKYKHGDNDLNEHVSDCYIDWLENSLTYAINELKKIDLNARLSFPHHLFVLIDKINQKGDK
jgi:hypothetical protein